MKNVFCFNKINKLFWVILCLIGTHLVQANAEEIQDSSWREQFLSSNKAIADWFNGFTEGVDFFLTNQQLTHREDPSQIRIQNSSESKENKNFVNSTQFSLRPRLPRLEQSLSLTFTNYDEIRESHTAGQKIVPQSEPQKNFGATLGVFRKLDFIRVSFQPRLEFENQFQISHSLGFQTLLDFKNFKLHPKLDLFANAQLGTGVYQAFYFAKDLSDFLLLTMINEFEYEDKLHKLSVTHGFVLGQKINDKSSLSYSLISYTNNRPRYHLENYIAAVSWAHLIYDKVLDYEFITYLDFQKTMQFKGEAGLRLNLNLTF